MSNLLTSKGILAVVTLGLPDSRGEYLSLSLPHFSVTFADDEIRKIFDDLSSELPGALPDFYRNTFKRYHFAFCALCVGSRANSSLTQTDCFALGRRNFRP